MAEHKVVMKIGTIRLEVPDLHETAIFNKTQRLRQLKSTHTGLQLLTDLSNILSKKDPKTLSSLNFFS